MENQTEELKKELDREVSHQFVVRSTTDYGRFKWIKGNRTPNQVHLTRLRKSIEKKQLFSPVLVNERFEIIDGQHRFLAMKELGLPIFYIITNGYGLEEIQILNTNTSNWKKEDYLKAYCDIGSPNYLLFKQFMDEFPQFGFQSCERLISLKTSGNISNSRTAPMLKNNKIVNTMIKDFENGQLQVPNFAKSKEYAKMLTQVQPYYKRFNRGVFVSAMILIFNNPNYNHDEMIKKLEMQPTKLVDCMTVTAYKLLLEEIYNFKRRDKINLRF